MICPHPAELKSEYLWVWKGDFGPVVLAWKEDSSLWTDFEGFQAAPGDEMGQLWRHCAGDSLTGLPIDGDLRPVLIDCPLWFKAHLSELGILD